MIRILYFIWERKSRNKNNKTVKVKADEVVSEGYIRKIRYGNLVRVENNISKDEHERHKKIFADNYPNTCNKINQKIENIQNFVRKFSPLRLLHRGYFEYFSLAYDKTSPSQFPEKIATVCRMVDYIQCIIVSDKNLKDELKRDINHEWTEGDEKDWQRLFTEVDELFTIINLEFHLMHSYYLEKNSSNYNSDEDKHYVNAQMHWTTVRGNRYYIYEIEHLKDLLLPHSAIFQELFNMSASEFIKEIGKFGESLVCGYDKARNEFNNLKENEKYSTEYLDGLYAKIHDFDLFNVSKITKLPTKLLECLSFGIGDDIEFLTGENAGWPLKLWSTAKRPFIKVNNEYFCFDQHVLFDELYRIIQKTILKLKPDYKETWNKIQQEQTESVTCSLFQKLLPQATVYNNVYTKFTLPNSSKQDWRENDALIIYDDCLIILEVKGGAFTYTPPAYDFQAFKKSLQNLMEKPAIQGQFFLETLNQNSKLSIYDSKHKKIDDLDIENFRNITICCCTLDNFTAFASKQNILKDLGLEQPKYPTWTLSIDDLRIYAELVDSPSQFLHFLEQRKNAVNSRLIISDELDHLSLYFKYNCYVNSFDNFEETRIMIGSHKEEIDTYYHKKYTGEADNIKPYQEISYRLQEILNILDNQCKKEHAKVAHYLLDLGEERESLEGLITRALSRQKQTLYLMPLHLPYKIAVSLILIQEGICYNNSDDMVKQVYANMIITGAEEAICLILNYDSEDILYNIDFEKYNLSTLNVQEKEEVDNYTIWLRKNRIKMYLKQNGLNRVRVNEQCPCGSGKKYKNCCI